MWVIKQECLVDLKEWKNFIVEMMDNPTMVITDGNRMQELLKISDPDAQYPNSNEGYGAER